MGITAARERLIAKLERAGVSAIIQDRLDLYQNGVYLAFEEAILRGHKPIAYRFGLYVVSSDFQSVGGAYETIDKLLSAAQAQERELGRASYEISDARLTRLEGALSVYKIAITIY